MIDNEKYNTLMALLQETTQRQKILDDSTRTPAAAELVESQAEMMKSVKANSSAAPANIVNYMKKKDRYVDEVGKNQNAEPDARPAATAAVAGVGTVRDHYNKITKHFKVKGITGTEKGLKFGSKTFNLNYEDVVQDLTHNYKANKMNLNGVEQEATLRILRKSGMPASYIRNKVLHDKYVNLLQTPKASQTATPPPPYTTATPLGAGEPIRRRRVLGQSRDYMTKGYLEATGGSGF
jgi:hypothetical protein